MSDLTPKGDDSVTAALRPDSRAHRHFLARERDRLWTFARRSVRPEGGFGWLDTHGEVRADQPVHTWITCRMTHVAALEALAGRADAEAVLDHGVEALELLLRDGEHDGWFPAVGPNGPTPKEKRAYDHAFVLLAATSAVAAGHPRAEDLLDDARSVFARRFWSDDENMVVDTWDASWSTLEPYRGLNANMHAVEAMLAIHDVTGEEAWLEAATAVVERAVHGFARWQQWLLPEHYDASWRPVLEYNRDHPADPFRPFGATVGHLFEWSRLALHLHTALGDDAPSWLLSDARHLFQRAIQVGWAVDGREGFVYTTDFNGIAVVTTRLHWVLAEAIAAAWAMWTVTGERSYLQWYAHWWEHAERYYLDRDLGSWHHALDQQNRPTTTLWRGKPDVYHAYQAVLLPTLGGKVVSFAGGLKKR
jgi:mannose/cellobiose epimerase-like protein (N-acyl-D-glucosamine 2-epimerase family)